MFQVFTNFSYFFLTDKIQNQKKYISSSILQLVWNRLILLRSAEISRSSLNKIFREPASELLVQH